MRPFIFFLLLSSHLAAWDAPLEELPLAYQGRYRPASVAAKQFFYEISNKQESDALQLIWTLYALGEEPIADRPLFWVQNSSVKKDLHLKKQQNRFSYRELKQAFEEHNTTHKEGATLLAKLDLFSHEGAAQFLKMIPSRPRPESWLSIRSLEGDSNGTAFPKNIQKELYENHNQLIETLKSGKNPENSAKELATTLSKGYSTLSNPPLTWRLQLETLYHTYPWPLIAAVFYLVALICLVLNYPLLGYPVLCCALIIHTSLLATRVAVLGRPPVSNMFETVLYVPWIAMLLTLMFRSKLIIAAGAFASFLLLTLIHLTGIDGSMENVQAVLNSNFWLTIHVLMIVGSYGVLLINGILAHIYLVNRNEAFTRPIRDTLYLGLGLLICGTILGGVWAAESWGRFWDWDPKESWAFITSCIYLIVMHLHRYGWVSSFGLSLGCVVGVSSVAFTWYGVNYILGTGLHSYGFGEGKQFLFWIYLLGEMIFIGIILRFYQLSLANKKNRS